MEAITNKPYRIAVKEAAQILGVSPQFIRIGMQQRVLPIGTAVKMSSVWTYHISPKLLEDYMGGGLPWQEKTEMEI